MQQQQQTEENKRMWKTRDLFKRIRDTMGTFHLKWKSISHVCLKPQGLYGPWNSPGQNTEVGSLSLLQGIFPTQGSNSGLLHCRQVLYQLSHKGSPWTVEWITYSFSSGSSRPRNWTRVSCTACGFFTRHNKGRKQYGPNRSRRY